MRPGFIQSGFLKSRLCQNYSTILLEIPTRRFVATRNLDDGDAGGVRGFRKKYRKRGRQSISTSIPGFEKL